MTRPIARRARRWAVLVAGATLLAACSAGSTSGAGHGPSSPPSSTPAVGSPAATSAAIPQPHARPVAVAALQPGERWVTLRMPGGAYHPQAEAGGTDDYRCILLDPKLASASFLSGVVLQPGNPKLVHHAILYRVAPEQVAAAQAKDRADPRLGWSCFGGPGLSSGADAVGQLDAAPWVAAWATSGGEQRFARGTGEQLAAGSRLILQMHYNLLNGTGTDNTSVRLRVAAGRAHLRPLHTMLLPAPVELPCPAGQTGPLCNRTASVFDVQRRFGADAGFVVAGLQLLCNATLTHVRAGPTQTCARPATETMHIQAVAGHMHLLGKSISVDLDRQDGSVQNLLRVRVWNFDDQRATVLAHPVTVRPGDRLRVTCTHDATLRQKLPELAKLPPRYVVWGEGSSDEMCLGIVSYTQS